MEDEFDEDVGGQMSHTKSVHSRLQASDSVFEEDLEHQYEESPHSKLFLCLSSRRKKAKMICLTMHQLCGH